MDQIIKIAAQNNCYGLKGRSKFKNVLKNKNCGDEIKIEFDIEKKKIINFRYEGEACIYCLASASLLSKNLNKLYLENLHKLQKQIYDFFGKKKKKSNISYF